MKKTYISIYLLVFSMFASTCYAVGVTDQTLIPMNSVWQYSIKPGAVVPANFSKVNYDFVDWNAIAWKSAKAGFSDSMSRHPNFSTPVPANNLWPVNTSLILQKTITYDEVKAALGYNYDVTNLTLSGFADNGFVLFVNGQKLLTSQNIASPYTYVLNQNTISNAWNQHGDNLIQIIALDWGGRTFFDMKMVAGTTPSATPIPAAVWLLGSGLAGIVTLHRRGRRA